MLQGQALFDATRHDAVNISQLAKASHVSTDTVRYYEKQGLIAAATR
jgi:hypothetical protein